MTRDGRNFSVPAGRVLKRTLFEKLTGQVQGDIVILFEREWPPADYPIAGHEVASEFAAKAASDD